MSERKSIYLDHSASTPVDKRVLEAMMPYFSEVYGNPSSVHRFGQRAERAIEQARETVARVLNCKPGEIVFTSCGSESDNLALRGAAWSSHLSGGGRHLVTTPIEHSAVGKTVDLLANVMGFSSSVVPVDDLGMVRVEDFAAALQDDTVIASVIYASNEVGTVQPLAKLATLAHEKGILFHTDAVQAAGQLSLDVEALGVDMLSVSAHKFYGPKGVGALYVRNGVRLIPSQSGGGHEQGLRAGTHNTPLIVGLAKALELAYEENVARLAHYMAMRDALVEGILSRVPDAKLTGHSEQRLPSHASFVFPGVDGNQLLMHLDMKGIAASSGSACKTGNPEPSGVLLAMGYDESLAKSSLRLSVGQQTTLEDVQVAVDAVVESVGKLVALGQM